MGSSKKTFTVRNNTTDDLYMSYYGPDGTPFCKECTTAGQPYTIEKNSTRSVTLEYKSPTILDFSKVPSWNSTPEQIVLHFDDIDLQTGGIEKDGFVDILAPQPSPSALPTPASPSTLTSPSQDSKSSASWNNYTVVLIVMGTLGGFLGALFLLWALIKLLSRV